MWGWAPGGAQEGRNVSRKKGEKKMGNGRWKEEKEVLVRCLFIV